ncbi:Hypothetical predicted protein, partial [Marmota monax]
GPMFVRRTMVAVSNSVFIEEIPGELVLVPTDTWQRMELLAYGMKAICCIQGERY